MVLICAPQASSQFKSDGYCTVAVKDREPFEQVVELCTNDVEMLILSGAGEDGYARSLSGHGNILRSYFRGTMKSKGKAVWTERDKLVYSYVESMKSDLELLSGTPLTHSNSLPEVVTYLPGMCIGEHDHKHIAQYSCILSLLDSTRNPVLQVQKSGQWHGVATPPGTLVFMLACVKHRVVPCDGVRSTLVFDYVA